MELAAHPLRERHIGVVALLAPLWLWGGVHVVVAPLMISMDLPVAEVVVLLDEGVAMQCR